MFDVPNWKGNFPAVSVNVSEGSTAKTILDKAGEKHCCYQAKYKKYAFGHSFKEICGVATDWKKNQYWWILINGKSAQYGVDGLKPKDGDRLTFKYKKIGVEKFSGKYCKYDMMYLWVGDTQSRLFDILKTKYCYIRYLKSIKQEQK